MNPTPEHKDLLQHLQKELSQNSAASSNGKVLTVSALTEKIKEQLEINFSYITVEGELSNVSRPSSGHIYATLKDKNSQISIVIFKSVVSKVRFELKDGLEVELKGQVTVYAQRGSYQIIVTSLTPKGVGSLQLAFEQLKEKLNKEGLFNQARKRQLPFLPKTIGLVTSLTGAAIKDFLTTVRMRCPIVNVVLIPVKVQGEGSAFEIAAAIQKFNYLKNVDVIVVGRGGGSLEDLWAFNEEIVARSIFHSDIPVVSAVGHEIDTSISDFVADVRALTPTHAGVLCVPDLNEIHKNILKHHQKLKQYFSNLLKNKKLQMKQYQKVFTVENFEKSFRQKKMHCDKLEMRLKAALLKNRNSYLNKFSVLKVRFAGLKTQLQRNLTDANSQIVFVNDKLNEAMKMCLKNKKNQLDLMGRSLALLSPLQTIDRGYSIVKNKESGLLIGSITKINVGDKIINQFKDGQVISIVNKIEKKEVSIE